MKDELVTIAKLSQRTGMSEAAIRGRIASGHWAEGVHYFRRGRRVMMSVTAVDRWFQDDAKKKPRR